MLDSMSTSKITPPRVLPVAKHVFLFAHPDDEVFIGGTMKMLLDNGADIHGIWLTSGDFFGGGANREKEHSNAMRVLGLDSGRYHLMRFPDLGLVAELNEAADALAGLLKEIEPDVIFVNAFEGGHPDHDCVNFLAYESSLRAGISPELFEFPLYNGAGSFFTWWWKINSFPSEHPPSLFNPLNKTAVQRKHGMIRSYPTQWLYMGPARLASPQWKLLAVGERYRPCPADRDHAKRPHRGGLGYERWFNFFMKIKFKDYQAAVKNARLNRAK
jgi:N-acetylglucosamine malate deacetylase 1